MQSVQTPVIPIVGDMVRSTPGVISLGQGVVHYGPPDLASQRAADAITRPEVHRYGPVAGIPPLLQLISEKLRSENGISLGEATLEAAEPAVIVTAGGNMGFLNAILAITDPGDEVVLLSPYYFNHHMAIGIAGCTVVVAPTDSDYQPVLAAIKNVITNRTRAVVTVSPNNPTGAVYPEATLRAINALCVERGVYHIHDEAYEYFVYDGARHFSPGCIAGGRDHTISLFSLSKSYGFAGWRIGYMVAPRPLLESIRKIQDTNLICPPILSQFAAIGALEAGSSYCKDFIPGLQDLRDLAIDELGSLGSRIELPLGQGAFYLFLRVDTPAQPMQVVERLIRDHGVAVMPGDAFGMNDVCSLRIAYGSLQRDTVVEAIRRLTRGLFDLTEHPS